MRESDFHLGSPTVGDWCCLFCRTDDTLTVGVVHLGTEGVWLAQVLRRCLTCFPLES